MGKIRSISPAALIAAITYADEAVLEDALNTMSSEYGAFAFQSEAFDFTMTEYYTAEMGHDLKKCFYCFEHPLIPDELADVKRFTNDVELQFARTDGDTISRIVNIDPGYVTLSKLVLASTKDYSHRIYIGKNIFAEITLQFIKGAFTRVPTTYPDYQTPVALDFFNRVRDYVKRNSAEWKQ